VRIPHVAYLQWAKALPASGINLARSGVAHCPPALLKLRRRDVAIELPVRYGYSPLKEQIAARSGVDVDRVFTVSGGTTLANWFACATALDGSTKAEVLIERPTYEPLVRVVEALGGRVKRFERRFEDGYAIDMDRFAALVGRRTRLAIVTNLHNPSGVRIDGSTLRAMARALARVGAWLLVDEVYLEAVFRHRPDSAVQSGANIIATSSLTKAYGLDGLRAGWMLGPRAFVRRAWDLHTVVANNGVAPGEAMALRAFERLGPIARRARDILERNLESVTAFFANEPRLEAVIPAAGPVVFPRLPRGLTGDAFAAHLRRRYQTLVVPGSFFDAPGHARVSFGCAPADLRRGLENISRALDDLHR
jgi:aspartate/methionine/tyrosine aminotransferase